MRYEKNQQVHVLRSWNDGNRGGDPFSRGVVTRVGRRYVYVTFPGSYGERRFELDTGNEVTNYSGSARTIMNDEQRADHERRNTIRERFRKVGFSGIAREFDRFSLDTIEGVLGLLEADYAASFEDVAR
jgi:hypothetical protein